MAIDFPDDENGDVLRRMQRDGDNFSKQRDINFSVVFTRNTSAEEFADAIRQLGFRAAVDESECVPDLPWDVTVTKYMLPAHAEITQMEEILEELAAPLGGRNDGWGCFCQPVEN